MAQDKIEIEVSAKVDGALKNIGLVKKETQEVAKPSLFDQMKKNWLKITAVTATVVISIKKVISAYAEQERAEKNLSAAMKQAGTFTEAAYKHNIQYASSLQDLTRYGDEAILGVQKLLTNFGIEGKALDDLTRATLDLASAKEMDLASAADIVAKSVGSSTNALSRYGITIEGAAGSTERAQMAVENIGKLFGGSAQADAQTFSGRIDQLKNKFGDFLEVIGKLIANVVTPVLNWFNKLPDAVQKGTFAFGILAAAATTLTIAFGPVGLVVAGVGAAILGAAAAVDKFTISLSELRAGVDRYISRMSSSKDATEQFYKQFEKGSLQKLSDEIEKQGKSLEWYRGELAKARIAHEEYTKSKDYSADREKEMLNRIVALSEAMSGQEVIVNRLNKIQRERLETYDTLGKSVDDIISKGKTEKEQIEEQIRQIESLIAREKELITVKAATGQEFDKLREILARLKESLKSDVVEPAEEAVDSLSDVYGATLSVFQSFADGATAIQAELNEARLASIDEWAKKEIEALESTRELKQMDLEEDLEAYNQLSDAEKAKVDLKNKNAQEIAAIEEKAEEKRKALNRKAARANKAMAVLQAALNIPLAISGAFAQTQGGITLKALAAVAAGVTAGINLAAVSAKPIDTFATGGSFVTNGPRMIQVGDNSSGQERVTVEPLSGGNSVASGNVYHFHGYDFNEVRNKIMRIEGRRGFQE